MEAMGSWWILFFVIIELIKRVTCNYECTMHYSDITCSKINSDQLSQSVSVTLNKSEVLSLNLTKGYFPSISPNTFNDFTNLQNLYISDCQVKNIEDNAFSHSPDLKQLYLNNNDLLKFNVRSVPPENWLTVLDLSYNRLRDFSYFNVTDFSKLTALNLAGNFLSYLPVSLLTKLKEQNQFFLVADNNPWNCSDSNWSEYLTDELRNAFCFNVTLSYTPNIPSDLANVTTYPTVNKTEITTKQSEYMNSFQPFVQDEDAGTDGLTENDNLTTTSIMRFRNDDNRALRCAKISCAQCSFYLCSYWLCGGIWLGIILGNVLKIKSLVCSKTVTYSDVSTQCEHFIAEQYMVSGFRLDFNRGRTQSIPKDKRKSSTAPV